MGKHLLSVLLFSLLIVTCGAAQEINCPDYARILANLKRCYEQNKLDTALLEVRYLRACTSGDDMLAEEWTIKIFEKIREQNHKAITAQKAAEQSEKKTQRALEKAERLSSHFNFGKENAAWAYRDGRFAVVDKEGNLLTNHIYETPETFSNGIALAQVNGQYVYVSDKGKELTQRYESVLSSNENISLAVLSIDYNDWVDEQEWVVIDKKNNNQSILSIYKHIIRLNRNRYLALDQEKKWVWLDEKGKKTGVTNYEEVIGDYYNSGYFPVRQDSLWGFIDTNSRMVIVPQFKKVIWFSEGLAGATKDSLWGFIDVQGNWAITPKYKSVSAFNKGVAIVGDEAEYFRGKSGLVDKKGNELTPLKYKTIWMRQSNGAFWVRDGNFDMVLLDTLFNAIDTLDGWNLLSRSKSSMRMRHYDSKWTYVDSVGNIIHFSDCEKLEELNSKIFAVKKGGVWSIQDSTEVISFELSTGFDYEHLNSHLIIRIKDDLFSLADSCGRILLLPQFEDIKKLNKSLFAVQKDTLWGLVDSLGKIIMHPQFTQVQGFGNDLAWVYSDSLGGWGLVERAGKYLATPQFKSIGREFLSFDDSRIKSVLINNKWGFVNDKGIQIVQPVYDAVDERRGYGMLWVKQGEMWGLIDTQGRTILEPQFAEIGSFNDGYAAIKKEDLWGFIDSMGSIRVEPRYSMVGVFQNGLAAFSNGTLWGFVNTVGEVIIAPQYTSVQVSDHPLIGVTKDSLWGLMDSTGRMVQDHRFTAVQALTKNLIAVREGDLWGAVDATGNLVISPKYSRISAIYRQFVQVNTGGNLHSIDENNPFEELTGDNILTGLLDARGKELLATEYTDLGYWKNDLILVTKDTLWGLYDTKKRNMVLPPQFKGSPETYRFDNCLPFQINDLEGLIDTNGRIVVNAQFDRIDEYKNGYSIVQKSGRYGLLDPRFQLILPCDYSEIHRISHHTFMTEQNGRFGLFNAIQGINIPSEYEALGFTGEAGGWIRAKKNGKWGWVDAQGVIKVPFRYDVAMPFEKGLAWVRQEPYPYFFKINTKGYRSEMY